MSSEYVNRWLDSAGNRPSYEIGETYGYDPLNLDGLSVDADAVEEMASVYQTLATYAQHKAKAMKARKAGDITSALTQERLCERIYNQLPKWARW